MKLFYSLKPFRDLDSNKTKAKDKKNARETKKVEAKEKKKLVIEAAREKKRVEMEIGKEKKKIVVEAAKEKKRVETKVIKEKKRVKIEVLAQKEFNNKAVKNVKAILEIIQINKHKVALLASNLLSKKKQQKMENNKPLVIKLGSKLESISKANSLSKD